MSSPLAIAAVTAAMKDLLNDGLLNHDLSSIGSFSVTALPPDRVTTGETEPNQLNLFLYQVTPNLGWRNVDLPSRGANGARTTNPPLALDLHYLLTAYGSQDLNAEVLLGYAMQLLHQTPVLSRAVLRTVLGGTPPPVGGTLLPSPFGSLSAADLADQIELIKITPVFLSTEDLSKMWTAMQARYRPTMAYMASVVLIQATTGARVAPPVLKRGEEDRGAVAFGSLVPTLASVRPAASDLLPAMRLGDDVLVAGTGLTADGTMAVVFENAKAQLIRQLAPTATTSSTALTVHVPAIADEPDAMHQWAVGLYSVSLRVTLPNTPALVSNGVPIALAPLITVSPTSAAAGNLNVTVTCTPRLRPDQAGQVSLIFGTRQVPPQSITTPAVTAQPTTLIFTVPSVVAGEYIVRLRVEGIDSLPITFTPALGFDPQQKVIVT